MSPERRLRICYGAAAWVAAVAAFACEPLGGLSGDGAGDGGAGGVDGSLGESGSTDSATSGDAGGGGDAATIFETSFDDEGLEGWTKTEGNVVADDADFVSPPKSMKASGGAARALLTKDFPGSWTRVHCTFQLEFPTNIVLHFVGLSVLSSSKEKIDYRVFMQVGTSPAIYVEGWIPGEGGARQDGYTAFESAPRANTWIPVEIDLDFAAKQAFMRLDQAIIRPPFSPPTPVTGIRLELGSTYSSSSSWALHYDDLLCELW